MARLKSARLLLILQLLLDDAQVGEGDGDLGVVGPVRGLLDGQGAFQGGAGGGQLTQLPLDDAQAGEGDGDLGVVGPVGDLLDGQGAFQGGAGGGQLTQLPPDACPGW